MCFIEIWGANVSVKATQLFMWNMNSDARNKTWGYVALEYVGRLDGIGYVNKNMGMAQDLVLPYFGGQPSITRA